MEAIPRAAACALAQRRSHTYPISPRTHGAEKPVTQRGATQDNSSNFPLYRQHKTYVQAGHKVLRIPPDAVFRYRKTNDNSETTGYRFATTKSNRPALSAAAQCRIARTLRA